MKKINIIYIFLSLLFLYSCSEDVGDYKVNGESINGFSIKSPKLNEVVSINLGELESTIDFKWGATESGISLPVTYKILFDKIEGDFSNPLLSKQSNDKGQDPQVGITNNELNTLFSKVELKDGYKKLKWVIEADNTSVIQRSNESIILIPEPVEGLSLANIVGPETSLKWDALSNLDTETVFSWSASTSTKEGSIVKYKVLFDKLDGDFSNPIAELDSDNSGVDTKITKSNKDWIVALNGKGLKSGAYKWSVKSYTENIELISKTSNSFDIKMFPSELYIVGGGTSAGWTPANGIKMNNTSDGVFEFVLGIDPANGGFLLLEQKEADNWNNKWAKGSTDGELVSGGGDMSVTEAGVYKLTVSFIDMTYQTEKINVPSELYVVGGSSSAGWSPGNGIKMKEYENSKFELFAYLTTEGDGFFPLAQKEDNNWNNKWAKGDTDGVLVSGGGNITIPEDAFYRFKVDFTTLKYTAIKMNFGIVGDATANSWDGPDQVMELQEKSGGGKKGSYTFKITTDLKVGSLKFRANNQWNESDGGLNFGDNGADGTLEYGGADIAIAEAGNYTVTMILDPDAGYTYTIVKN